MSETQENQNHSKEYSEALSFECESARLRLQQQSEIIQSLTETGARMIRVSLLVVGLVATGVSAFGTGTLSDTIRQNTCSVSLLGECSFSTKILVNTGIIFLLGGIFLHFMGQRPKYSDRFTLFDNSELETESEKFTLKVEYLENKLITYQEKIDKNEELIETLEQVQLYAQTLIFFSIVLLSTVLYNAVSGQPVRTFGITITIVLYISFAYWYGKMMPNDIIETSSSSNNGLD